MSMRSTVESLPPDVRRMVRHKLHMRGFKDYLALAAEMTALGYPISGSALQRFGAKLQESVRQADLQELRQSSAQAKQVKK